MKVIRQLDDALARVEKGVIVFCFWLLVGLVVFNILSRHLFHLPSHQVFEIGPRLVLWLALFGATLALRRQRHIRLELIMRHLSRRIRFWAAVVVNLFGAAVMGLLLVTSLAFVQNEVDMFGGWGWLAVVFPVFFSLATLRYLMAAVYPFGSAPAAETAHQHSHTR
jgi:TRAP-type C4-dicarboxylate transport system permease small subunit